LGATGNWSIRVNNPDGGQSSVFNFNVAGGGQNPAISSINPGTPITSGADQNVIVNGNNFQPGLRVDVSFPNDGVARLQGTGQIQNVTANSFLMRITLNGTGNWTIRAINPDGTQSGQFSFNVQASGPLPSNLPTAVLSPVIGPLRVTTSNQGINDGKWEFDQHKTGLHTPTGGISLSNDTLAWDVNLYTQTSGNADAGKAVYAVADGEVVSYVGTPPGGGPGAVLIAHPNRLNPVWFSGYLHMTNVRVSLNQQVNPATVIGDIGRVGADNDHLHFVVYSGQNTRGNLQSFNPTITERLSNAANAPAINLIEPSMVNQSNETQLITINGTNFQADSIIEAQDPNKHSFTITRESILDNGGQITDITATSITARVPFAFSGNYEFAVVNRPSNTNLSGATNTSTINISTANTSFAVSGNCTKCTVYSTPSTRTPVILIPGIMGSRLAKREPNGLRDLWLGGALGDLNGNHVELANNVEDPTNYRDISLRPVIATELVRNLSAGSVSIPTSDVYDRLITYLTNGLGYTPYDVTDPDQRTIKGCDKTQVGADLFIFPYDWRNSNWTSARDLYEFVQCIKSIRSPNQPNFKVDIIAHSMGGLVARRYILNNPGTHYVDRMVTLGTPWLGAPKVINVMETGDYDWKSINLIIANPILKAIAPYIKGAQELIPSKAYTDDLATIDYGKFPLGEDGWDFNKNSRSEFRYDFNTLKAEMNRRYPPNNPGNTTDIFHSQAGQDDWRADNSGVSYYQFVGYGKNTIGSLIAKKDWLGQEYLDIKETDGDGTVPLASATRVGRQDYRGPIRLEKGFPLTHKDLASDPSIFPFIGCVINNQDPSNCINNKSLTLGIKENPSFATGVKENENLVGEPNYLLKVIGSSSVLISDSFGNTTNPLSTSADAGVRTVETNVTGNNFISATFPLDQNYQVVLRSPASTLSILLTKSDGQTMTQAIRYVDVTLPPNVLALLEITPQGVTILKYDSDGNGTFDTTVNPTITVTGTPAQDIEPPVVTVNETVQNGTSQIVLVATDAGTGVQRIMYSVDGKSYQPYTVPLTLNPSQTPIIYAFADDNVANRSGLLSYQLTPGSIRIDGVTPLAGRASGGQQIKLSGSFVSLSTVMMGGVSASWSFTNGTGEIAVTTPPHAVGVVSIDLVPSVGATLSKANVFAYLPTTFTDDTLVAGVTTPKAQHIIELRQAIDALRVVAGLQPAPWTDAVLVPTSTMIKAVHIQELRSYLEESTARLGYPAQSYTDSLLSGGFLIKRLHIEELRQRIRAIAN
jgi:murein DD-endopeptidase MepM/ murein hydrolase activator NlpD/pimeloyl-ACP methyl ester carboxylesterase